MLEAGGEWVLFSDADILLTENTVAAVCHGGVINAYITHILNIEDPSGFFYPNYTSIHRVAAARGGERTVLSLNETAHLRGRGFRVGRFGDP